MPSRFDVVRQTEERTPAPWGPVVEGRHILLRRLLGLSAAKPIASATPKPIASPHDPELSPWREALQAGEWRDALRRARPALALPATVDPF